MTGPPVADPPLVAFIPVDSTCLAVGFGSDVTPYDSALQFDHPFGRRIQDATAYPSDCSDALIERRLDQSYSDAERNELRVSIAGRIEQTFPEDFSYPIWTGEIQYTEPWEGRRTRTIVLDHVPSVPAD